MFSGERLFGIIYTTIGIGLLLIVFYLAYQMLTHPVPGLALALAPSASTNGSAANSVSRLGSSVIAFLLKLAVLFVMTLAGSHVAARGIQLYHGAGIHASAALNARSVETASGSREVSSPAETAAGESAERQ